jgi:glutaminyl-tRNA synthetase
MPTLSGMRRRGYTPESIRRFCTLIGVAKADNRVDLSLLEYAVRDDLNHRAPRVMVVLDPLEVELSNWPADRIEWLDASYWPHDVPKEGTRPVPFGRTLVIERDDFMEDPPKKFHRLSPGEEVRLRYGYIIRCDEVVKDTAGKVQRLRCSVDLDTRSGETGGRRVKGTIHWVEATHAVPVEVRLYDRLFTVPDPEDVPEGESFIDRINPHSGDVAPTAMAEHSLRAAGAGDRFQFERQGYFFVDPEDSAEGRPVFNRTVTLRDTWAKIALDGGGRPAAKKTRDAAPPPPSAPPVPAMTGKQEARARELAERYGIAFEDAALLATDADLRAFFEAAAARSNHPRPIANWVVHDLQRERKELPLAELALTPEHLAELVDLVEDGTLSSRLAKDVFADVLSTGRSPREVVDERGLVQIDDPDHLAAVAREVVAAFPDRAEAWRGGKTGLIGFFVGQVMQRTGGKANPQLTRELLEEALAK